MGIFDKKEDPYKGDAFLRINGIRVPISSSERVQRTVDVIGEDSRSVNGNMLRSNRAYKDSVQYTTCPLDKEFACALENIIKGDGESFEFTDNTVSKKGLGQDLGHQLSQDEGLYMDIAEEGRFGQGAFTRPTRLNLSSISDTFVAVGSEDVLNAGAIAVGSVGHPIDSQSAFVNMNFDDLAAGLSWNLGAIGPGYYVISFFTLFATTSLLSQEIGFDFSSDEINNGSRIKYVNTTFGARKEWQRHQFIFTKTTASSDVHIVFRNTFPDGTPIRDVPNPAGPTINFYVDSIYLEKVFDFSGAPPEVLDSSNASIFTTGGDPNAIITQGVYSLPYNTTRKAKTDGWTMSFWIRYTQGTGPSLGFDDIVDIDFNNPNNVGSFLSDLMVLRVNSSGDLILFQEAFSGGNVTDTFTGLNVNDEDWHLITLTIESVENEGSMTLYLDGRIIKQYDHNLAMNGPSGDYPYGRMIPADSIGQLTFRHGAGADLAFMSDLQILPYSVPQRIVRYWAEGNRPQACAPRILVEQEAAKRKVQSAFGKIDDVDVIEVADQEGGMCDLYQITFTVTED